MSDSVKKYNEMMDDGHEPKESRPPSGKSLDDYLPSRDDKQTIEEILQEANAYGIRQNVIDMVENMKKLLQVYNLDENHNDLELYQEAFDACTKTPEELYNELKENNGIEFRY